MRLFHASLFFTQTLQPGFYASGELVQWDGTESNHFLYATTDRDEAIDQGFFSAAEKKGGAYHFKSDQDQVTIRCDNVGKLRTLLEKTTIHLYQIDDASASDWSLVRNQQNNLENEYKTGKRGVHYSNHEQIPFSAWSRRGSLLLLDDSHKPAFLSW